MTPREPAARPSLPAREAETTRAGPRRWLAAPAFALAYLLLDHASFIYPMAGFNVTPWNPQPSLAIAFLMIEGQRRFWVVLATLVAAELANRGASPPLASAAVVSAVLALGYAAMAAALNGRFRISVALRHRGDVLRLLGVVLAGSLFTGAFYVAAIALTRGHTAHIGEAWLRFWIGDTVGIFVSLPLILMALDGARRAQLLALLRTPEMLIEIGAVFLSLWLVFAAAELQLKYFYVLFLPLVWIAGRHGMAGTACAMVLLQVGVIVAIQASGPASLTVFELQSLLLALAITGFFVAVTVDERERISDDLRRSLKLAAAGEMAAAITHELNQPLTALNNYARACQRLAEAAPPGQPELLKTTLAKISAESLRAGEVIRRLRDLFKGGVGTREPIDLGAVAEGVVKRFQAQSGRIDFRLALPPRPLAARADRVQIEVVLRNLLQNAVDALQGVAEPWVEVRVGEDDGRVRVDVLDAGPGIAAKDLPTLFEPFLTAKPSGMGIGLPMSRAIVEAHGGELAAAPGPGGRVSFFLPLAKR